jgi:hypothetical protein
MGDAHLWGDAEGRAMGDVVADAAATLRQPVPVGSPVRGQAMVALARSASADDARRLRSALTADAALAAAFGRLSSATRAAILEELNRKAKAQAAPLDVRGTNNRGTDNRGTDNRGTDNRGTDNRGTDNRGTDNRGTDNRGTDNRGTDALSPAVPLGQSRPPGTGGPFANTQSRGDVWEEVSNLFDGALAANLRALVEEVRITPRLKRMFAWGEVQVYLALSLRKARVRRPNRAGLGLVRLGVEVGIEDFEDAVVAATKVVLLKAQGLRITEVGITTPTGEVDVGFNLQFSPAFPVALEVKWSQLLTHQQSFPGYEMGMDFEVTMVVDVLPTVEKLKELAGERIYKLQRFFEERGGRVIRWGRDAVTAAVRSRRAVVRGIGRLLLRAGRGARTVVRGALATAEVVALPLDSQRGSVELSEDVVNPSDRVLGRHKLRCVADGASERRNGSGTERAQHRLHLRPAVLDGIEVRRVRRHVQHLRPSRLDSGTDARRVVGAEVVHHDDVVGLQHRDEVVVDEGSEDLGRRAAFDGHHRLDAVVGKGADHGQDLAAVARYTPVHAFAPRGPPVVARHRDVRAGLVEEDEAAGRDRVERCAERLARGEDRGAIALGRDQRLFFSRESEALEGTPD